MTKTDPARSARVFRSRRMYAYLAILAAAIAYAAPVADVGWNQGAHYALVRSLYRGSARVDRDRWLTGDLAWVDGHFYSTKAPGLALASMPAYAVLRGSGAESAISRRSPTRWRAARVSIWALGLWSVVVPATLLLLLVRRVADRLEPGLGTAAALSLGLATLILPFASLFFVHVLSALLGFAAFVLLWRERDGPASLVLVGGAGLLAGLAFTAEYSLVFVGLILGFYAIARRAQRPRRGIAYAAGALVGVAPLLLYNRWAFGSALHLSYGQAVRIRGSSGHDVLGANASGFFGVGVPNPRTAIELLFASRGLLTLSPVLVMGAVGTALLFRRGRRAEALVISAITVSFLIFNAAYYLPFGGSTPGPRFLIPILPFLAVPLALAFRRYPATTLALAVASMVMLVSATATFPLLRGQDTGKWADRIRSLEFQDTVAMFAGVRHGWLVIVPFIVPLLLALVFGALATGSLFMTRREALGGLGVLGIWALAASLVPRVGTAPGAGEVALVACATLAAALAVAWVAIATRSSDNSGRPAPFFARESRDGGDDSTSRVPGSSTATLLESVASLAGNFYSSSRPSHSCSQSPGTAPSGF